MKVLFGTVFYPDAVKYTEELSKCLRAQTILDFNVLVITDNIRTEDFTEFYGYPELQVDLVENLSDDSPQALRVKLIKEAKERNADILIFGDADDTFSETRIEDSINSLLSEGKDFIYNDIITEDNRILFPSLPDRIDSIRQLLDYNFLGLSNTAIRMNKLSMDFILSLNDCDTFTFDWYLYSRMLDLGLTGEKTEGGSQTFYRIHEGNFAGIPEYTKKSIIKEIEVKKKHYSLMKKYNGVFTEYADAYVNGRIRVRKDSESPFWWNLTEPDFSRIDR